jgi:hypothetical protein
MIAHPSSSFRIWDGKGTGNIMPLKLNKTKFQVWGKQMTGVAGFHFTT